MLLSLFNTFSIPYFWTDLRYPQMYSQKRRNEARREGLYILGLIKMTSDNWSVCLQHQHTEVVLDQFAIDTIIHNSAYVAWYIQNKYQKPMASIGPSDGVFF